MAFKRTSDLPRGSGGHSKMDGVLVCRVAPWGYYYEFDPEEWEEYSYWWKSNADSWGQRETRWTMSAVPNEALEEAHEKIEKDKKVVRLVRKGTDTPPTEVDWLSKLDEGTVFRARYSPEYYSKFIDSTYQQYTFTLNSKFSNTSIQLWREEIEEYIWVYSPMFSKIYILTDVLKTL